MKIRMIICEIFLNGWRSSQMILRTKKRPCALSFLRTQIRNVPRKWYQSRGSTVFSVTSQKTEIAKYACEPKLRRLNEEGNHGTITDTLSWFKMLPLNGSSQVLSVQNKNLSGDEKGFTKASQKLKVIYTDNSLEFEKSCEEL